MPKIFKFSPKCQNYAKSYRNGFHLNNHTLGTYVCNTQQKVYSLGWYSIKIDVGMSTDHMTTTTLLGITQRFCSANIYNKCSW